MSLAGARSTGTDLAALHREHYRALVRLAAILVDDVATCEELAQDAFVAVKTGAPSDETTSPPSHPDRRQPTR